MHKRATCRVSLERIRRPARLRSLCTNARPAAFFLERIRRPARLRSLIIIRRAQAITHGLALLMIHFRLLCEVCRERLHILTFVVLRSPESIDERNHRCSELKNQARRCTLCTYNFASHLSYRTPVIQQRLPPLLLLLGSSVRNVRRNHKRSKNSQIEERPVV